MQNPIAETSISSPEATRKITEQDVDWLIDSQRKAIRYYLIFAFGLIGAGIGILLIVLAIFGLALPEITKGLLGIGCGFISSLSAFQIKEVTNRSQSVKALTLCKTRMHSPNEEVRKSFEDLAWKSLEKIALG
jgi:hypothetical protein